MILQKQYFLLILLFGFFIDHSAFGQNKKELRKSWNQREKVRVQQHLENKTRYKGVFHDGYREFIHDLQFSKDSVRYHKLGVSSSICTFPFDDPGIALDRIFGSYLHDDEGCRKVYSRPTFLDMTYLGKADGEILTLVRTFAPSNDQGVRDNFTIYKVNKFGLAGIYDSTTYTDQLFPLKIFNNTLILFDAEAEEVYAIYNGQKVDLPPSLTAFMVKAATSYQQVPVFDIMDGLILTTVGENLENASLVAYDLEKGQQKVLTPRGFAPRIIGKQVYFLSDQGMERIKLNGKKRELLFSEHFFELLKTTDFLPLDKGDKFLAMGRSGFRIIDYRSFDDFAGLGKNLFCLTEAELNDLDMDEVEQVLDRNIQGYFLPEVSTISSLNGAYEFANAGGEIRFVANNPLWPIFGIEDGLQIVRSDSEPAAGETEVIQEGVEAVERATESGKN